MTSASPHDGLKEIEELLHSEGVEKRSRYRALAWLCRLLLRAVPGASMLWLVLAVLTGLVIPIQLWASQHLIDNIAGVIEGDSGQNPWPWVALMAGVLITGRVIAPVSEWAMSIIRERAVPDVQARIFTQATRVDLATLEYRAFYDTTQRISQQANETLQKLITELRAFISSAIPAAGTAIIILAIDWRLAAVLILPLAPILLESLRSGAQLWTTLTDQTRDRRLATYIATRFSDRQAAKEIRLYGLRDTLLDRWAYHFMATRDQLRRKATWLMLRVQLSSSVADIFTYAGFIWLLTGTDIELSPGQVTVLMTAFMTIGNQAFTLQQSVMELGNASGFAHDIRAFLALPAPFRARPGTPARHTPSRDALVAQDLRFAYPGTHAQVIDGISLVIPPGQVVAIVGENGAGKTTLLKILLGLYMPDKGEVLLGNRPLRDIPVEERQSRFSAVFQQFTRYPLSFQENIVLDEVAERRILDRVVPESGLEQMVADAPDGIETMLAPDLGGVDLSGGQWQRVAIARAAYRNADILALDEPTAALDPMAEVDIFRRFSNLARHRTTLLVSHRLGMARLADRIIVVEHGRITEDGSHHELLDRGGHYAELWEMQARWYQ